MKKELEIVSVCTSCHSLTHTIKGTYGKCGEMKTEPKEEPTCFCGRPLDHEFTEMLENGYETTYTP